MTGTLLVPVPVVFTRRVLGLQVTAAGVDAVAAYLGSSIAGVKVRRARSCRPAAVTCPEGGTTQVAPVGSVVVRDGGRYPLAYPPLQAVEAGYRIAGDRSSTFCVLHRTHEQVALEIRDTDGAAVAAELRHTWGIPSAPETDLPGVVALRRGSSWTRARPGQFVVTGAGQVPRTWWSPRACC